MKYYIGIDLGGTNIAAGLTDERGKILEKGSVPTKSGRPAGEIVEDMAVLANSLVCGHQDHGITMEEVEAIGIGVPGTANQEEGIVEYANNLGFFDTPIISMLEPYFPGKVICFDNDANAAAWAEYIAGSGQGCRSMIAVTLGTGIGGGIIIDGKMFEGVNDAAGELGHMVIDRNGKPCNCGRRGCFEKYASATALVEQTKEAMEQQPSSLLWELCGGHLENVDGKILFDAVRRGDGTAKNVLAVYTEYLGIGLIDIINIFQPEVICLGGGISQAGELLLEPLQNKLDQEDYARSSRKRSKLVTARLGNDAGIIGAALLAKERTEKIEENQRNNP